MPTLTVRRNFKVEGVLTDVTSAKLNDATATYGVKRNDTNAVVVASGEDMTKVSTGVYEYSFTALNGVAYTAWSEFVYSGSTYRVEHDFAAVSVVTADGISCSYQSLVNDIGFHCFGLSPSSSDLITDGTLSDSQEAQVLRAIRKGLLFVYGAYRWSFLRPKLPITTTASDNSYSVPTGYDSFDGEITFAPSWGQGRIPIRRVDPLVIRRQLQDNSSTGKPKMYALFTDTFDPTVGSTRYFSFYPIPDATYQLEVIGTWIPAMLDAENRYPLGGTVLSAVITEACLAAAERDIMNIDENHPDAVHCRAVMPLLQSAIMRDREYSAPDTLGIDRWQGGDPAEQSRRTGSVEWKSGGHVGYWP